VAKANVSKRYAIFISPSAERDLKRLQKTNRVVLQSIDASIMALALDPRPPGIELLKGSSAYRKRDGEYRILYDVDDAKLKVTIQRVRDRKDVYRH
jgi:mRNA interferase RelE/StbE